MRLVAIIGEMRSGTSLVASIVHHLGFQVAPFIPAPMPPAWRSDWEDPQLSTKLMLGRGTSWGIYLEWRKEIAEATGFKHIAVKSPYLALYWEEFSRCKPYTIRVTRNREDVDRSFAAHPQLSSKDQARIRAALEKITPDLTVAYEDREALPMTLASALGVEDESAIERAFDLIGQPTEYTCPLS